MSGDPGGMETPRVALVSGGATLVVPARGIRQIVPARGFTAVPLTRSDVIGVMVQDRRAIPVYRFSVPEGGAPPGVQDAPPSGRDTGRERRGGTRGLVAILEDDGIMAGLLIESTETITGECPPGVRLLDAREILRTVGALGQGDGAGAGAAGPAGGE